MRKSFGVVVMSLALATGSAVIAQPEYRIIDLTEIAGRLGITFAEAEAINNAGEIIGRAPFGVFPDEIGLMWKADLTPIALPMLPLDTSARPHDIKDDGTILGVSSKLVLTMVGGQMRLTEEPKAVTWLPGNQRVQRVDRGVTGGELTELRVATGVNASGIMIGQGYLDDGVRTADDFRGWTITADPVAGACDWVGGDCPA